MVATNLVAFWIRLAIHKLPGLLKGHTIVRYPAPIDKDVITGYNSDWICIYPANSNLTAIAGLWDMGSITER